MRGESIKGKGRGREQNRKEEMNDREEVRVSTVCLCMLKDVQNSSRNGRRIELLKRCRTVEGRQKSLREGGGGKD